MGNAHINTSSERDEVSPPVPLFCRKLGGEAEESKTSWPGDIEFIGYEEEDPVGNKLRVQLGTHGFGCNTVLVSKPYNYEVEIDPTLCNRNIIYLTDCIMYTNDGKLFAITYSYDNNVTTTIYTRLFEDEVVVAVEGKEEFIIALTTTHLYAIRFGDTTTGAQWSTHEINCPVPLHTIVQIAAHGEYISMRSDWVGYRGILTQDGDAYLWNVRTLAPVNNSTDPVAKNVKKIIISLTGYSLLKNDGTLVNSRNETIDPRHPGKIIDVETNHLNMYILMSDGTLLVRGSNQNGELGASYDNLLFYSKFRAIPSLPKNIVEIQGCSYGITARCTDGSVYLWGTFKKINFPTKVDTSWHRARRVILTTSRLIILCD